MTIRIAYDDRLLNWGLGKGHPTNPIRAKNAVRLLSKRGLKLDVRKISGLAHVSALTLVHDEQYVRDVIAGKCDEWAGARKDLGVTARLMFQGTVDLVEDMIDGEVRYGFSPQGAKHHAQFDHSSGFCVFNDFAYAATAFADAGHRVLYIDTDAHHGDGVENLTAHDSRVTTCSIHDGTIFPGTGHVSAPELGVYNFALPRDAGDTALVQAMHHVMNVWDEVAPTVVLFAIGGDGYVDDPLSSLEYTYDGYRTVAKMVGERAGIDSCPILFGGAGGYLPETATPRVWANVVEDTYRASELYTGARV